METKINAQSIINQVMAAHAIAPNKCDLPQHKVPHVEKDQRHPTRKPKITYETVFDNPEYIIFRTSERGTQKVLNCKENLQRFADLVRKNAAAFGGGLIKEEKQKPAVSYPSKSISLYKQLIEDKDWHAALQLAEEKLSPLFAIDRGTAYMFVAPIPLEEEPRIVSLLGDCGEWTVAEPVAMRFNSWHKSRQKAEDAFFAAFNARTQEQKDAFFAARELARIDQSAARAQWMADHGIVDDAAIEARIESQASQDVAEVVAQAMAVSAIAEAMAPAAEEDKELVKCEAQESSTDSASGFTVAAYNTVTAMLASFTPTPAPTPAVSSEPPAPRPVESTNFAADIPLSLAVNAFHGVSMSPERRGASAKAEYAQSMAEDYETLHAQAVKGGTLDLLPEVFARYRGRQAAAYRAYLASSSRCVSSFIAGPSNFPAARMNKRADIAHQRLNDYLDGGKMAMQAAIRTLRPDLRAIMAGDADAIDRLTVKIANAERAQERMKEANKAIRANAKAGHAHQVDALMALGFSESQSIELIKPDFCGRIGFANYQLTNNNANIRRMRERLEQISKAQAQEVKAVECSNGITLEDDAPANRIRLYFPCKPDEATRTELKSHGFRWSPTLGAWQAYRNYQTITTAKRMAGEPTASAQDEAPSVAEVAPIEPTTPPMEIAQDAAPAHETAPAVAIEAATPAMENTPEPVSPVVGTSTEWAPAIGEKYIGAVECAVAMANMRGDGMEYRVGQNAIMERRIKPIALQTTKTDDHAKFNIRAKSGAWFACVYMIGTVYGLRFEAKGMEPITGEFATHQERMAALEMMANALNTPPDGGLPIATVDAPTEAHTPPVAECTPDTPPMVSRAKPEHDLKVGDVVRSSWGYDQTNVNHYQITKLIGKRTVEVRELVEHKESTGDMTGHVAPVWGEFIGEPMRRTVDRHGHVNILREKFGRASKIEPVAVVHGVRCYASTGYSSYA